MKFLIINGPNINMLGVREPEIYGIHGYDDLVAKIEAFAAENQSEAVCMQSNSEGELIDILQRAPSDKFDAVVINPGAYTHYSYAIADALRACPLLAIEVHLSNIYAREEFRKNSVTAPTCVGQISGLGFDGYLAAMTYFLQHDKKI